MTENPETIFLSLEGNYIYRHHVEPRDQLYAPKVESFPIPLRYFGVIKRAHTSLKRIETRRNHAPVSRSSHYEVKSLLMDTCGPGGG